MKLRRKQKVILVVALAVIIIVSTFVSIHVLNTNAQSNQTINIDGNLKASVSTQTQDLIWIGTDNPLFANSFSGNAGQSQVTLGFNYSDPNNPFGTCNIQFVNASGNRPFPFMNTTNGAFPVLYLSQISHITVHFDIKLNTFEYDPNTSLRMAVVIVLDNGSAPPSSWAKSRIYFEQDIQDSPKSAAGLPYVGSNVAEIHYQSIKNGTWVHLNVSFQNFMQQYSTSQFAKSYFASPNSTFLGSVYLVNECFGSGHVNYDIKNFWITVEKTQ